MKTYYDERQKMTYTEARLKQLGFPTEDALLLKIGIFPITCNYPSYNADEQTAQPVKDLVESPDCLSYIQNFDLVDLSDEERAVKAKAKLESSAKADLLTIDAETTRPLRAWINGEASEWDLEKLYDLECRAKKARAVLQGKPEPVCQKYAPGIIPSGPTVPPTTPTPQVTQPDEPTSGMESNPQA